MFSWVQYFQSHVFSVSSLPLWVSPSEQAKQQTFCFSINVFYLFRELRVFSSLQWPLQGHLGEPADIWWRLQKHVGGCQAVNPDPPDVSIHIVFKQTPSLWQKHRELRRNEGGTREAFQNAFLTSRFPSQAVFCLREPWYFRCRCLYSTEVLLKLCYLSWGTKTGLRCVYTAISTPNVG